MNDETDVIAVLNDRLRVIRSTSDWVMQRRKDNAWVSFGHSQTKAALLMRIEDQLQRRCGQILSLERLAGRYVDGEEWAVIQALPDFFPTERCR